MRWTGVRTDRAWLFETAVNGHVIVKCGHLLGKLPGCIGTQPLNPLGERGPRRLVQADPLRIGQSPGQFERGQPGGMENLVRIRVADAADQVRIGERAFDGVALACQRGAKLVEAGLERLESARVERGQRLSAANDLQ